MRRFPLLLVLVATACADAPDEITGPGSIDPSASVAAAASRQTPFFRPGVVVVRFTDASQIPAVAAEHRATPIRSLRRSTRVLRVPEGTEEQVVRALSRDPRVIYAELSVPRTLGLPCTVGDGDCQPPTDTYFNLRWDLNNDGILRDEFGNVLWSSGLVADADTDWLEAFDQLVTFTGTARLGVIDTGIYGDHPDLIGRLVAQYDAFNQDPIAEDDNGHGTHVSGIGLAYGDDGIGTTGIAWGPNVELVVAKGCGLLLVSYVCWSDDVAAGIEWAVDNGANVINLSLGGNSGSQVEQDALQYALANDVLPICAAGNDKSAVDFPGAYPECMAVAATDWADELASYSSFGPEVEVAAPGGDTLLASGYDRILSSWNNGGYVFAAGTSMASPHVAGLATLLHALGVTSAQDKRDIIRATADDLGPAGFDSQFGDGRVNVWSAVLAALGSPPPPPPPNQPPTAGFTSSCSANSCLFTDTSTDTDGLIVQWSWDFGDGQASAQRHPTHVYSAGGTYTVTLTVTDNRGDSDTVQQTVTVTDPPPNQPPLASFTPDCTDNACQFVDASTDPDGSVVAWDWDFGDGSGSAQQSPSHPYAAAGDYTVTLTVTDNGGATDSVQQTVTVSDPPPLSAPVAGFTYSCTDNFCQFTDTSSDADGYVAQWSWSFGDGSQTSNASPAHTYATGGDYTVVLSVTDNDGLTDVTQQTVTVGDPPPPPPNEAPTAGFTYACTDNLCQFTDTSTDPDGNLAQWSWSFGDGSFSTTRSPSHAYATADVYTVQLVVTDFGGLSDIVVQTITVGDPPPPPPNEAPVASYTFSCQDLVCSFTDTSTDPDDNITQWSWSFGDGSTSSTPSPAHTYSAAGSYLVRLTVTDAGGLTDFSEQTITVTAPAPNQPPTASFTHQCTDNVCQFTDTSSDPNGSVTQWNWTFGDGSSTANRSPGHTYAAGGDYTVTLTVTDDEGLTDVAQQVVSVGDPPPPPPNDPPVADFTHSCQDLLCFFTDASTDPDGNITQWGWAFGDGSFSTTRSPSHGFAAPGDYVVRLTVTDAGGLTDFVEQTVTVGAPPPPPNEAPQAAFAYGCQDLLCSFMDTSTDDGSLTSWSWTFGDGSNSGTQSPTHQFAAGGQYLVTLTVTDDGGLTDTAQQTVTVTEPPALVITLTATPDKIQGQHVVRLAWTGAPGAVDVYRNGAAAATVPAGTQSYSDATGGRGKATYTYRVCESGGGVCSNEAVAVY